MTSSLLWACVGLGLLVLGMSACQASGRAPDGPERAAAPQLKNVEFLEQYAATRGFTHGTPKNIAITPDGSAVFFLRSGPRSFVQDLFVVDTATGNESTFLTAEKVLAGNEEKLTAEELARRERMRLASRGIASYSISKDGRRILVPLSGRLFVIERDGAKAGAITELKSVAGYPIDPQFSPDGAKVACVREGDLYVTDIAGGAETRLTTKTGDTITNGLAEFVAQEEMDRFRGFWWSPNSKYIAYEQADTAGMEMFHIADAMSPEKEAAAWPYPRPGKKNATVKLGMIPAGGGDTSWIDWDREKQEYVAQVNWNHGDGLTVVLLNRAQTTLTALTASHREADIDGRHFSRVFTGLIETQSDPAWLNLVPMMSEVIGDSTLYADRLWMSERDGEWTVRRTWASDTAFGTRWSSPLGMGLQLMLGVSKPASEVVVLASDDPTQSHVYGLSLDSGTPRRLTNAPGVHTVVLSEESPACVHTTSTLDGNQTWTIRNVKSFSTGYDLKLTREEPPWVPRLELDVVGEKAFHAALIRPRDFDVKKKYPVIVNVYGGPHHQMVRASPQLYYLQQWIADQGFIIAMIDGRGTPNRGRDWERAIKNDLIGPALEDQVAGLKALGAKHPEMDLSRVGIYGWSFGGYFSAMATMQRPDVYMAGCAGAPVCDWLDYDTCYTERYLGVPKNADDPIYKKSSVLTYCKDLQRPLLIIHGTSDDNVYFMHSLKMTQALFREGKHFEFLPLAGFTHMVPDPVVTTRLYSRIALFFKENLGEPK